MTIAKAGTVAGFGVIWAIAAACAPEPARPEPAAVSAVSAEGTAGAAGATASDASAITLATADAGPAPDAGSPYPPTGRYQVSAKVTSDDCLLKSRAPEPRETLVYARAEKKKSDGSPYAQLIIPLSMANGILSPRRDLVIVPKEPPNKLTATPLPQCSSYQVTRTTEVTAFDGQGFTLAITTEHGDSTKCSSTQPTKCTTKVEEIYKVTEAACAAECTRGMKVRQPDAGAAGKVDTDCRCP